MATDRHAMTRGRTLAGVTLAVVASVVLSACGSAGVAIENSWSRGIDAYDAGDYQEAIREYQAALSDNPDDHRIYYNLGLCFHDLMIDETDPEARTAWFEKARSAYQSAQALTASKARAQVAECRLLWDAGEQTEAVTMLAGVVGDDGSGVAMPAWMRGTMLMSQGKMDEAAVAYEESLAAEETYLPALTALAAMRFEQGRFDEAEALIGRGLEKAKHDVTLMILYAKIGEVRARDADAAEREDAWNEAMLRWRTVEGFLSADWEMLLGVATCAEALGDVQLAVRYLWFARDNATDAAIGKRGGDGAAVRAEIKRRLLALYPRLPASE